ncbi:type IV pilus assembly protein PilM [Candidatus Gracilibacteria bacterium]|nr:type IV pilus assembly protein PilM [Candidatus Gracilibacteria bacterium]MCF7898885.1 type IV pilus assembly protein PilM [Candidatus Paceibacterota bacterium]
MFELFKKEEVGQAIGLDIGPSSIKVVQLRREKERVILDTYGEVPLGPYGGIFVGQAIHLGEEKVLEAINNLFKEAKVTAHNTVIAIDPSATYVSLIKVPKVDDDQLRTMIPIEARKYIPIPLTEVQMDWWHVPTTVNIGSHDELINIVLAAVNNETLAMYDRLVKKLGLTNVEYEIHGYSVVRSSSPHTHKMVLYVDIGSQSTTLSLVHQNIVLDMHVISHGSQESTLQLSKALSVPIDTAEDAKRTFGYKGDFSNPYIKDIMQLSSYPLFGEVARLSLMYERKYNQHIEGIILTGGGARVSGVLDVYSQTVHIAGRVATPFERVKVPEFLSEMIERVGPTYAVALGCALKKLIA